MFIVEINRGEESNVQLTSLTRVPSPTDSLSYFNPLRPKEAYMRLTKTSWAERHIHYELQTREFQDDNRYSDSVLQNTELRIVLSAEG